MPRRVVIVLLQDVPWQPPGVSRERWRAALAEDMVDLAAGLAQVQAGIAAAPGDRPLAESIAWPGMPIYDVPGTSLPAVLRAAEADGYDEAVVLAPDAPDLPGLLVGKLLRPLTSRPLAVAPATIVTDSAGSGGTSAGSTDSSGETGTGETGSGESGSGATGTGETGRGETGSGTASGADRRRGLLGLAARLPVPPWLPDLDLDGGSPAALRAVAPGLADVAVTPAWRRLRGPADLATLDPAVEGWEATRALLSGRREAG